MPQRYPATVPEAPRRRAADHGTPPQASSTRQPQPRRGQAEAWPTGSWLPRTTLRRHLPHHLRPRDRRRRRTLRPRTNAPAGDAAPPRSANRAECRSRSATCASGDNAIPRRSAIDCRTFKSFMNRLIRRGFACNFSYRIGVNLAALCIADRNEPSAGSSRSSRLPAATRSSPHARTSSANASSLPHSCFARSRNKYARVSNALNAGTGTVVCTILWRYKLATLSRPSPTSGVPRCIRIASATRASSAATTKHIPGTDRNKRIVSRVSTTVGGRHRSRSSTNTTTRDTCANAGSASSFWNSSLKDAMPLGESSDSGSSLTKSKTSSNDGSCKVKAVRAAIFTALDQLTRFTSAFSAVRPADPTGSDASNSALNAPRISAIKLSLAPTAGSYCQGFDRTTTTT